MKREELIKALKDWKPELELMAKYNDNSIDYQRYRALDETIKALEQHPCEDCISRADVRRILNHEVQILNVNTWKALYEKIDDLPSIQPKPKTGHWKKLNVGYGCSECSLATNKSGVDFYRFCPNCGAKMESEE